MNPRAAVVGGGADRRAEGRVAVEIGQIAFIFCTGDQRDRLALRAQRLCQRIQRRHTDAAADKDGVFSREVQRKAPAERAEHVNAVSRCEPGHHLGALSDNEIQQRDGAGLRVNAVQADGPAEERVQLFSEPDVDKLPRSRCLCNLRCVDFHGPDVFGHGGVAQYFTDFNQVIRSFP